MSNVRHHIAMGICFLVFVISHSWSWEQLYKDRMVPWEPDDSYHALVKAANFENCWLRQCKGLEDLYRISTTPDGDMVVKFARDRQIHRVILSYDPLYSWGLLLMKILGGSYDGAHRLMGYAGIPLMGLSIGFFSYALFGPLAASLSMLGASFIHINDHGIHTVVPFSLSSVIAFLAMGVFVGFNSRRSYLMSALLAVVAMGFHQVGVVLSGIVLFGFLGLFYKTREKNYGLYAVAIGIFGIVFYKFGFSFVSARITSLDLYNQWTYAEAIKINFERNKEMILHMIRMETPAAFLLSLLFLPIIIKKEQRFKFGLVSFALFLLLCASFFYPSAHISLLYRIWSVYPLFFLTILCGVGAWGLQELEWKKLKLSYSAQLLSVIAILLSASSLLVINYKGFRSIEPFAEYMRLRADETYVPEQVDKLLAIATADDKVLYEASEAGVYFYLTHGASKLGLAWEYLKYKEDNLENVKFAVVQNSFVPYIRDLSLERSRGIEFEADPGNWQMMVFNQSDQTVKYTDAKGEGVVPARFKGWINLTGSSFRQISSGGKLRVWGVKLNESQNTFWPWGSANQLYFWDGNFRRPMNMDLSKMIATPNCKASEVLHDMGVTVLVRAKCN